MRRLFWVAGTAPQYVYIYLYIYWLFSQKKHTQNAISGQPNLQGNFVCIMSFLIRMFYAGPNRLKNTKQQSKQKNRNDCDWFISEFSCSCILCWVKYEYELSELRLSAYCECCRVWDCEYVLWWNFWRLLRRVIEKRRELLGGPVEMDTGMQCRYVGIGWLKDITFFHIHIAVSCSQ